jgi:hypothetical protein
MNKEQYLITKRLLQKRLNELNADYLTHSPFKVGDLVLATSGSKQLKCFIGKVEIDYDGNYRYEYKKLKNDGTMGNIGAGIYYPSSVALIKRAEKETA